MNLPTLIVLAVVVAAVALAIFFSLRSRKKGGGSCGCSSCPHSAACPSNSTGCSGSAGQQP